MIPLPPSFETQLISFLFAAVSLRLFLRFRSEGLHALRPSKHGLWIVTLTFGPVLLVLLSYVVMLIVLIIRKG